MITFDVLMRYFLTAPQLFVDELASFLLVLIIFGGLAHTFQRGGHIQVDLLTNKLSPRGRRILRILTLSVGIAFLVVVTWNTLVSSLVAYRLGRLSMVLFLPLWIPMLLIPLGVGLMALVMGVGLSQELRGGGKSERDSGAG
jgi:TRAP-type C4-dicarboxylate transport system permease small subunit